MTAAGQAVELPDDEDADDARPLAVNAAGTAFALVAGGNNTSGETGEVRAASDHHGTGGVGGTPPPPDVLPLPDVLPVPQQTLEEDLDALNKGVEIAQERAEAAREAAQQALEQAMGNGVAQLPVESGEVIAPTVGTLTSCYCSRWGSFHSGIDIANSVGTPIYAVTDGVVVESGPASGFGLWVRVRHPDDTVSIYGHINESLVSEGEKVSAGERIATMGNRGYSTGPHLHFEIWLDGERKVDPLAWLREHGVDI